VLYSDCAIVIVFKIEIALMLININLLFRNNENNCYSATLGREEIVIVLLNSLLLFQINNLNSISIIQNSIIFFTILTLIEKSLFFSLSYLLFSTPLFLCYYLYDPNIQKIRIQSTSHMVLYEIK
jgi:hypothetical protein